MAAGCWDMLAFAKQLIIVMTQTWKCARTTWQISGIGWKHMSQKASGPSLDFILSDEKTESSSLFNLKIIFAFTSHYPMARPIGRRVHFWSMYSVISFQMISHYCIIYVLVKWDSIISNNTYSSQFRYPSNAHLSSMKPLKIQLARLKVPVDL